MMHVPGSPGFRDGGKIAMLRSNWLLEVKDRRYWTYSQIDIVGSAADCM